MKRGRNPRCHLSPTALSRSPGRRAKQLPRSRAAVRLPVHTCAHTYNTYTHTRSPGPAHPSSVALITSQMCMNCPHSSVCSDPNVARSVKPGAPRSPAALDRPGIPAAPAPYSPTRLPTAVPNGSLGAFPKAMAAASPGQPPPERPRPAGRSFPSRAGAEPPAGTAAGRPRSRAGRDGRHRPAGQSLSAAPARGAACLAAERDPPAAAGLLGHLVRGTERRGAREARHGARSRG